MKIKKLEIIYPDFYIPIGFEEYILGLDEIEYSDICKSEYLFYNHYFKWVFELDFLPKCKNYILAKELHLKYGFWESMFLFFCEYENVFTKITNDDILLSFLNTKNRGFLEGVKNSSIFHWNSFERCLLSDLNGHEDLDYILPVVTSFVSGEIQFSYVYGGTQRIKYNYKNSNINSLYKQYREFVRQQKLQISSVNGKSGAKYKIAPKEIVKKMACLGAKQVLNSFHAERISKKLNNCLVQNYHQMMINGEYYCFVSNNDTICIGLNSDYSIDQIRTYENVESDDCISFWNLWEGIRQDEEKENNFEFDKWDEIYL